MPTLGEKTPLRPFLSFIDRAFSFFRQKNGRNPSETDITVVIPAPTQ